MINKVSFTGREGMLTKINKEAVDVAKDYLGAGKVYSAEEISKAAYREIPTKHQFVPQDKPIIKDEIVNPVVQKSKDVDIDFFAETAPHRFDLIG